MARRRKKLRQRLLTYEQLDAKYWRAFNKGGSVFLYGRVAVGVHRQSAGLWISYSGEKVSAKIADVFRAAGDATLYAVHGIGKHKNSPEARKAISAWERYVPVFTPHAAGRLYAGERAYYLLKDGVVTVLPERAGTWGVFPRQLCKPAKDWPTTPNLPNFVRRCRLFVTRLRKELAGGPACEVQLSGWGASTLFVCTAPHGKQNGRVLTVTAHTYEKEARQFHGVDGDYGIKHCHFVAQEGDNWREQLRWKCSRDAITGIKEWVLGSIYIPGL